jgi:hypothetical protein
VSGVRFAKAVAAAAGFAAAVCGPLPSHAAPVTQTSLELMRPLGDTYDERASDGDAYPQSVGMRLLLARGGYAVTLQYWRNVYHTDDGAAGALTRYPRLEGGYGTVTPFIARDSSLEAHAEFGISHRVPLYAGLGVLRTWTNYHYPVLTGAGAGLDLHAATSPGARPFASAFYYPAASGTYAAETAPARSMRPAFGIFKIDVGTTLRRGNSRLYAVLGYGSEVRTGRGLSNENRFIRSDAYAGLGLTR